MGAAWQPGRRPVLVGRRDESTCRARPRPQARTRHVYGSRLRSGPMPLPRGSSRETSCSVVKRSTKPERRRIEAAIARTCAPASAAATARTTRRLPANLPPRRLRRNESHRERDRLARAVALNMDSRRRPALALTASLLGLAVTDGPCRENRPSRYRRSRQRITCTRLRIMRDGSRWAWVRLRRNGLRNFRRVDLSPAHP